MVFTTPLQDFARIAMGSWVTPIVVSTNADSKRTSRRAAFVQSIVFDLPPKTSSQPSCAMQALEWRGVIPFLVSRIFGINFAYEHALSFSDVLFLVAFVFLLKISNFFAAWAIVMLGLKIMN